MFFVILLILLLLFFLMCFACFWTAYYAPPKRSADPRHIPNNDQHQLVAEQIWALVDNVEVYPYELVQIKSYDGLTLSARYYHVRDNAPIVITFHGFRSTSSRDCAGIFKVGMELGFNMLLPDMRSHGLSQGRVITLGIRERYDCLSWVNYAIERFGNDSSILLVGCSMGAASVMMSAELLPKQVKGMVCDCGYSSPKDIISKVAAQMHMQPNIAYFFLRLAAKMFAGFDPEERSSVQSLANSKIPALFIHGEDDRYVPCSMVYENYEACAADIKQILTVPSAGHGLSFIIDEPAYRAALMEFFKMINLI